MYFLPSCCNNEGVGTAVGVDIAPSEVIGLPAFFLDFLPLKTVLPAPLPLLRNFDLSVGPLRLFSAPRVFCNMPRMLKAVGALVFEVLSPSWETGGKISSKVVGGP